MKIIVDAMGGDLAPKAVVEGAVLAAKETDCRIGLIGLEKDIVREKRRFKDFPSNIDIIDAPEVIQMNEAAALGVRRKRNSSIVKGIELIRTAQADSFFSAGNTGAVVCAATLGLGMLSGVERPGIAIMIPTLNKTPTLVIDVGANIDAKPAHLLQYAAMAHVYYQHIFRVERPSIGLLNIGEEEIKGTDFLKESHKLLSDSKLNFTGNLEGRDIFKGKFQIVICDGFVGNIALKVSEGVAEACGELLKRELMSSLLAKIGLFFIYNSLRRFKKNLDYSEYGGAPLLGVNGVVIIGHGRSSAKAIKNAIKVAVEEVKSKVNERMVELIRKVAAE